MAAKKKKSGGAKPKNPSLYARVKAEAKRKFKEDWRDVKTGKKCGRSGKEKKSRPYPACRPRAVAGRISKAEARKKTGPKAVKWSVTASGRKRKTTRKKK